MTRHHWKICFRLFTLANSNWLILSFYYLDPIILGIWYRHNSFAVHRKLRLHSPNTLTHPLFSRSIGSVYPHSKNPRASQLANGGLADILSIINLDYHPSMHSVWNRHSCFGLIADQKFIHSLHRFPSICHHLVHGSW